MIQEYKSREDYKKIAFFLLFATITLFAYCTYVFYINYYYSGNLIQKTILNIHYPFTLEGLLFLKALPFFSMLITYLLWQNPKPIDREKKKRYSLYAGIFTVVYLFFSVFEVFYYNTIFTAVLSVLLFLLAFYFLLEIRKTEVVDLKKDRRNVVESQFDQQREFILTDVSVNIQYNYDYLGKSYNSYANVVNPFRGSLVGGTPGSGKTFAIIEEYFRQFMMKGFSGAYYDYKFPTLGTKIYNYLNWYYDNEFIAEYKKDKDGNQIPIIKKAYPIKPKHYTINLDDPAYSHRCNPISADSLVSLADADDATKNLLLNINKTWIEKEGDFFTDSANVYTSMLMWYLKLMTNKYDYDVCSLPHLIALSTFPSTEIMFLILSKYNDLKPKMTPFMEALEKGALEQLAGQVASAGIALSKISSAELFYILTGNDFDFNINDPLNPKIICVGNNPQRDDTYAAPLGLILAKIIKAINVQEFYQEEDKKVKRVNLPSFLIIDEFPTIYLRSIDKLIGTARSNKVAVVLGFQSFAQVVAGYTQNIADKIIRVCGNRFTGQLMDDDAKIMSETIGKQKVLNRSFNYSHQDVSENQQVAMEEILPAARIAQLSQGDFAGIIADDFAFKEDNKIMFGSVIPPLDLKNKEEDLEMPMIYDFAPKELEKEINEFKEINAILIQDIVHYLSNTTLVDLTDVVDKDNKSIILAIISAFDKEEGPLLEALKKIENEIEELEDQLTQEPEEFTRHQDLYNLKQEQQEIQTMFQKTELGIKIKNYKTFKDFYTILDLKAVINKVLYLNKDKIENQNKLSQENAQTQIEKAIKKGLIDQNKQKIIKEVENDIYNDIYRIVALEVIDLNVIQVFYDKNPKGLETLKKIFNSIIKDENFTDKVIKKEYNDFIGSIETLQNMVDG